jgi:hypothetical protein
MDIRSAGEIIDIYFVLWRVRMEIKKVAMVGGGAMGNQIAIRWRFLAMRHMLVLWRVNRGKGGILL